MTFESLGLSPELLRAVVDQGYTEPSPIQVQAIPIILAGQDVQAAAQTGTGKTAGFTLPILQRLQPLANTSVSPAKHPIRCLVLTPTRELAAQVEASVKTYSKYIPIRSTVIFGGVNMDPQIKALQGGVEIVVATPGRLLDHVQQRTINLSQVEILVLDEADRMLDMGFIPDIRRIVALLPARRQNLLFSATFSDDIKKLSGGLLNTPVTIEVARRNATADLVRQMVYHAHKDRKRELLTHLIRTLPIEQAIVFMRTKHGANRLCSQLIRDGINAEAIHSDKTQSHRTQSLADFKEGQVKILVATDIAARGLDVDQMPYVVNYELPHVPEDYIHRIGRTGRAGSPGNAISLVCDEESRELAEIEKLIKSKIEVIALAGFDQPGAGESGGRETRSTRSPRREERPVRSERPARAEASPRAPEPVKMQHAAPDETPVRRTQADSTRGNASQAHFSRPPAASLGKKSREVPALLGGFPKKIA